MLQPISSVTHIVQNLKYKIVKNLVNIKKKGNFAVKK